MKKTKDEIIEILKNLINIKIAVLGVAFIYLTLLGFFKVVPKVQGTFSNISKSIEIKKQTKSIEKKISDTTTKALKQKEENRKKLKFTAIYVSPFKIDSIETASAGLVEELLNSLQSYDAKVMEISYNDNNSAYFKSKSNIKKPPGELMLNLSIYSNYEKFGMFLDELTDWKNLVLIKDFKMEPMDEDGENLRIDFSVILFVSDESLT